MADAEGDEYICPACSAPVKPDWQACPSCGVEFAPPEAGQAAAEGDLGTSLDDLEAEILGPGEPTPEEADPIGELEREIDAAVAVETPTAVAAEAPAAAPPESAKGPATRKPAGLVGKLGGLLGTAGLALLLVGALGALVAANYDTWVRGQAASSVGSLQQLGIIAAAGLLAVGVVLMLLGSGKLKRKGARAG